MISLSPNRIIPYSCLFLAALPSSQNWLVLSWRGTIHRYPRAVSVPFPLACYSLSKLSASPSDSQLDLVNLEWLSATTDSLSPGWGSNCGSPWSLITEFLSPLPVLSCVWLMFENLFHILCPVMPFFLRGAHTWLLSPYLSTQQNFPWWLF